MKTNDKLSREDLSNILDSVTADVAALAKAEAEEKANKLAKADPGEEVPAEATPEGSVSEPPPPTAAAPAPAPEGMPPEASAAPAPEGMPPEGSPEGDPAAEAGIGPEALQAEYSKLPPEELKMHLLAAKAAYMAAMGGAEEASPEMGAPAAPPAAAPVTPGPEASMARGEFDDPVGGKVEAGAAEAGTGADDPDKMGKMGDHYKSEVADMQVRLAKAEQTYAGSNASLKKALAIKEDELSKLDESLGKLTEVVSATLIRPMRKSVTGIEYITKPGTETKVEPEAVDVSKLTKKEVVAKLTKVTASPDLKKSERDLVNKYMFDEVTIDKVAHLIK